MRHFNHLLLASAAVLSVTALAAPASAATVLFRLTPNSGTIGSGTGSLTTPDPIPNTGLVTIANANLSFTLDGTTFANTFGSVSFLNGSLFNVSFSQLTGTSPDRFSIATSANQYVFSFNNLLSSAVGTISVAPAVAAVPEPATWGMMLLGVGAVGFGLRRRKGNVRTSVRFA